MPALEVKGLKEAVKNFNDLTGKVKLEIGREALRDALLVVLEKVKGATYTTFTKRTGAIQSGFGVRVGQSLKDDVLTSVVVEYPQTMIGNTPMTRAFRSHHSARGRSRKPVSLFQVAYWWRFLEFGTGPRRTARTPKTLTPRKGAKGLNRAIAKFKASRSTGSVTARPWVRPAFAASAQTAVDTFTQSMRRRIERAANAMPK
jgi:HK97 gp10 family phage protein